MTAKTNDVILLADGTTVKRNPKLKMGWKRIVFIISFCILPIYNFLLFYVYTNASSFLMAFQGTNSDGSIYFTLENFSKVFDQISNPQSEMVLALGNTFKTFLINIVMYPITVVVSYFLYKKIRLHNYFRITFYLPTIVSGIVFSQFYIMFVSPEGPAPAFFEKLLGLDYALEPLADYKYANLFVWIHMVWLGFPGNLVIWGGTFSRIPDSVVEYAKIDGVGWVREMCQIILPMVWPTFSLFLILQLGGIFGASGQVFLLTFGEFNTQTLSNWFYMQVYGNVLRPGSSTFNYMSAWGFCITVIACTISFVSRKFLTKLVPDVEF